MRIDELDEYQGITSEMLGVWLDAHGWDKKPHFAFQLSAPTKLMGYSYTKSDYFVGTGMEIVSVLESIATCEKVGIQVLLREINQRMRPWPSVAARRGHSGLWLVTVAEDETGAIGRFGDEGWFHFNDSNILTEHEKFARYWPCDANGNKVRWPTDEHGNML